MQVYILKPVLLSKFRRLSNAYQLPRGKPWGIKPLAITLRLKTIII